MTDRDEEFMRAALAEAARAGEAGEVPVGAVAVFEGRVVAAGRNEKEEARDPTAHAEMAALRRAAEVLGRWRLTGVTLYATLEPCAMCAGAAVNARIDRLVYGCADPKAGAAGSLFDIPVDPRLNHRVEVERGVLAEACAQLLKDFFSSRRA